MLDFTTAREPFWLRNYLKITIFTLGFQGVANALIADSYRHWWELMAWSWGWAGLWPLYWTLTLGYVIFQLAAGG